MSTLDGEPGRGGPGKDLDSLLRKGLRFDCPLCHSSRFSAVFYRLHDGTRMKASFYRCAGCDFGFTNPEMFFKPAAEPE